MGNTRPAPAYTMPDMGAYEEQETIPGLKTANTSVPVEVKLYPNPVSGSDFITISTTGEEIHTICLFDYTGNKIREIEDIQTSTVDLKLNALSAGMHFVMIHLEGGVQMEKFLVY